MYVCLVLKIIALGAMVIHPPAEWIAQGSLSSDFVFTPRQQSLPQTVLI